MLVNSESMLIDAKKSKYSIPQFNINNLEWTKYILEEAQLNSVPVILGVSEGAARYMGGYNVVVSLVKSLIKDLNITIDVCIHLDHGTSFSSCKAAIDAGFTSVMIDASKQSLENNIKITKEVVDYAHSKSVTVEAEIGHIGGEEDGINGGILIANLEDCIKLVQETKIDSLAPALGSVHGLYKGEPNLDYVTMEKINNAIDVPLVLHGGTGIPDNDIKRAISCGISKININTELQIAWYKSVKDYILENDFSYDPRKVIGSGEKSMKEAIASKINLFFGR